jgi:general L-amino acid transport system permease protein
VVAVAVAVYGIGQNGLALIAGPTLRGFNFQGGLAVPSELLAILLGISLFSSAYVTEIIRGGILAIPEGMIEAARALGLSPWAILVKVIFPLAIRSIIIPLGSQYTTIVKLTSLGLAVGYSDLFAVTTASITHSGQTIALVVVMSLCYSVLNLAIVRSVGVVNARLMLPGHRA